MTKGRSRHALAYLLVFALALILALTACATAEPATTASPSPVSTAETAQPETPVPNPTPQAFRLTILHNNDGESQVINAGRGREDFGGAARFAALVAKLRQEARDSGSGVLVLSAGDSFRAGPEFSASLARSPAPFYDVIALDLIGYDAIVLGNHEFDFGPDVLADAIRGSSSQAPFLSANLDFSGEPRLAELVATGRIASSTILADQRRKRRRYRRHHAGSALSFQSAQRAGGARCGGGRPARNRRAASGGREQDHRRESLAGRCGRSCACCRAAWSGRIDCRGGDELLANAGNLLLPGDKEEIFGPYPLLVPDADSRNVPVGVAPGRYTYVGRLIVEFDASGVVTAIDPASGPMRVVGGDYPDAVEPHAAVQEQAVAPVADFIGALARTPVGIAEVPLDGQRRSVRSQETNQGNLIADALLWQANVLADRYSVPAAHVALQNGGGIRNDTVIPPGTLYELDVFSMAPFSNFLAIVPDVPVEQFKEILENAVSRVERGDGRFPQIAGFTMTWDPNGTAPAYLMTTAGWSRPARASAACNLPTARGWCWRVL